MIYTHNTRHEFHYRNLPWESYCYLFPILRRSLSLPLLNLDAVLPENISSHNASDSVNESYSASISGEWIVSMSLDPWSDVPPGARGGGVREGGRAAMLSLMEEIQRSRLTQWEQSGGGSWTKSIPRVSVLLRQVGRPFSRPIGQPSAVCLNIHG